MLVTEFHMRSSFDALVERLLASHTSLTERELLQATHWNLGEDARLREDLRFRETPWGRWMLAEDLVANDAIYRWLHAQRRGAVALDEALTRAADLFGRRCVFCIDDPRFVLRGDDVHLSANELSRRPVIDTEVGELEKYITHLPLHSLRAAAASEPAGEWGPRAQEQVIETLGWVRVSLDDRRLNDKMFIAEIEGHSMDDGRSGLVDGGYAVFELWPSGTRQHLNVLVRGAFRDPETGSYAVKKFVADARDAEGRHHKVSLVSLNPDKERFPDIELTATEDDAVTVVAKVVQALDVDDYARRPKPRRRVGRRDLTGPDGVEEQSLRLGRRLAAFFDGAAPVQDDDAIETGESGWQTRLVCLELGAGGLHMEFGPLDGLPPFVKKLRAVGSDGWKEELLAANVRQRPSQVRVRPATGPWRWEAVGFEEEQDLGLEKLALDALGTNTVTVFRVDADGIGQRVKGPTLSLGQAYRLLLPPGVGDESLGDVLDDGPGGGWRLWSIDLGMPVLPMTRQSLTSLGLDVGEASLRLEWALTSAAAWRTNARGESCPVFELGTEVVVGVSGVEVDEDEAVVLFLRGPASTERLALTGDRIVSLGEPAAGRWACALLHSRTSVQSATLLFEVAEDSLEHVAASCSAVAHSGLASFEAAAPPGWPVTLRWCVFAAYEELLATVHGNEDGTVPVDGVASIIEARAARARLADLIVDFAELGRRVLPHDGRALLSHVREQLTDLCQKRFGLVQSRKGAWLQLRKPWFEPVTELFGYRLEDTTLLADVEAPHDLTAWVLTVDERTLGSITRSPSRVLVLTTDLDAVLRDHRMWIDSACSAAKVRDAIITDGARWTTHRKGNQQLKQQVWSLEHTVGLGSIDEMLGDLAEGL